MALRAGKNRLERTQLAFMIDESKFSNTLSGVIYRDVLSGCWPDQQRGFELRKSSRLKSELVSRISWPALICERAIDARSAKAAAATTAGIAPIAGNVRAALATDRRHLRIGGK